MKMNTFFFSCIFLILLQFTLSGVLNAQIVDAYGISGGITLSKQKWNYTDVPAVVKKKFLLGYNGSAFIEFFHHDYIRWVSELQFNQKGTVEKPTDVERYKNRLNYLSFNNFIKLRYEMYSIIPYLLAGPRVEYLLFRSPQIHPEIINSFNKLHLSVSGGAGVEFVSYYNIKFFTEIHYNPDITNAYKKENLFIKHTAFEARIGLKYVIDRSGGKCPPVRT